MCKPGIRLVFLPVLAALVLSSCASLFVPPRDAWIGQTKEQVQARYGAPNGKSVDGHGGEIWVYLETVYYVSHHMTDHGFGDTIDEYLLVRQFYIDASGVVYNHRETPQ